ncbi:hypothetical protein [Cellulomonas sp. PhB143]|uniref:hypothetical protein n=1 Tax=Cellulomonas sp. PhB143 TaxID=2485186 RepID=UPI000FA4E354|nr:hypothetical protein [Cellulomonas sp. PhB143]ROS78447.1 hypothetical protein EDF32_0343 [Cellulomonas sp. PhB143]
MLQRIIGLVLVVAGVLAAACGVASATVWRPDDTVVAKTTYAGDDTLLVTDPGVLDLVDEDVTIRATTTGDQPVTLAIGRDVDVRGWVGDDPYVRVTGLSDWDTLATASGAAPTSSPSASADPTRSPSPSTSPDASAGATPSATPEASADATADAEKKQPAAGPDPAGSDMWFSEASGKGSASLHWTGREGRWSLVAAGVGKDASAPTLQLTWPRTVTTPWLWPGIVGGVVLVLVGGYLVLRSLRRKSSGRRDSTGATGATSAFGPAASGAADGAVSGTDVTATSVVLTRRELRERAAREEAARAAEAASQRSGLRGWLTGQIPVVRQEPTATDASDEPGTPAADGDAPASATRRSTRETSASGDAWRRTWGFGASGAKSAPKGEGSTGAGDAEKATGDAERSTDGDTEGDGR